MSTNNHLTTARLNTMEQNGANEAVCSISTRCDLSSVTNLFHQDNTDMEYYLETSQSLRSNDASAMAMELVRNLPTLFLIFMMTELTLSRSRLLITRTQELP